MTLANDSPGEPLAGEHVCGRASSLLIEVGAPDYQSREVELAKEERGSKFLLRHLEEKEETQACDFISFSFLF